MFGRHNKNQRKGNEEKKQVTEDALKAAEMRKRLQETFTESENRNSEEITLKTTRNNGRESISYLTAKHKFESNVRKEELALRREEIETKKTITQQPSQLLSVLFKINKTNKPLSYPYYKN